MTLSQRFKQVYLVDSFAPASHHEQYNASMAIMLASLFDRVIYYVGDGQKSSVMAKLKEFGDVPEHIEWRRLGVSEKIVGKKSYLLKHLRSLRYNLAVLLRSKRGSLLIYNYNNPLALFAVKLLNLFTRRKIIFITHGELEYIINDPSIPYARTTRWIGKFFKASMRFHRRSKDIFYLVLGDSIRENLIACDVVDPGQVISLDHPYLFIKKAETSNKGGEIKTIGVKNIRISDFDTDRHIKALAAAHPDLTFGIIGAMTDIEGHNIKNYTLPVQRSRKEYEQILSSFDAMLFLYPATEYKLKASGAIFDAIELGIPILAVRNDYFDHLFRQNGPLGYLHDDIPTMLGALPDLRKKDHSDIARNIAEALRYHSPENLAGVLKQKLTDLFCA